MKQYIVLLTYSITIYCKYTALENTIMKLSTKKETNRMPWIKDRSWCCVFVGIFLLSPTI